MTALNTQDEAIGDYTQETYGTGKPIISEAERRQNVVLVAHLHKRKNYRVETFHVAVSIMDRYFSKIIMEERRERERIPPQVSVVTASVLMAAKLQQPMSPSFNKMIE